MNMPTKQDHIVTDLEDLLGTMKDSDFLDNFMNISDFHQENTFAEQIVQLSPDNQHLTEPVSQKRSAGEDCSRTGVDHNYIKKSKLSAASDTKESVSSSKIIVSPNEKYWERRRKNNIASRRSRETKKQKYVEMEEQATRLIAENKQLQCKIQQMESLAVEMKAILIQKLSGKA